MLTVQCMLGHIVVPSQRKMQCMSMVIAVREDNEGGPFIGFELDHELLECSVCTDDAAYRLRYTADQRGHLVEHRFQTMRAIEAEHPTHTDRIRIA